MVYNHSETLIGLWMFIIFPVILLQCKAKSVHSFVLLSPCSSHCNVWAAFCPLLYPVWMVTTAQCVKVILWLFLLKVQFWFAILLVQIIIFALKFSFLLEKKNSNHDDVTFVKVCTKQTCFCLQKNKISKPVLYLNAVFSHIFSFQ